MGIKYYKKFIEEENRYQYEERSTVSTDAAMIEITVEEYATETAKQWEEYVASLPVFEKNDSPSYDELLAENAGLEKEDV